jgi:hypothetical protein
VVLELFPRIHRLFGPEVLDQGHHIPQVGMRPSSGSPATLVSPASSASRNATSRREPASPVFRDAGPSGLADAFRPGPKERATSSDRTRRPRSRSRSGVGRGQRAGHYSRKRGALYTDDEVASGAVTSVTRSNSCRPPGDLRQSRPRSSQQTGNGRPARTAFRKPAESGSGRGAVPGASQPEQRRVREVRYRVTASTTWGKTIARSFTEG